MNRTEAADMRAHLHAVLCGRSSAVSTDDLADLAPWQVHSVTSGCRSCHPDDKATPWRVLECHTSWHLIERPRNGHDVHPHLQRLERDRLIERHRVIGDRKVYWTAIANPVIEPMIIRSLDAAQIAS